MKRILFAILTFCCASSLAAVPTSDSADTFDAPAVSAASAAPEISETPYSGLAASQPTGTKQRFLPTRRRIDREIDKIKFAYKGEVMMGLTASYGTLSSDETDYMLILDNISASGKVATVKPFVGYFFRDNHCLGVRFGYRHVGGTLDTADIDLGERNDISLSIPYFDLTNDNYSFGVFLRSYAGLDPRGRFGLFAEFELAVSTGSTSFAYESGNEIRRTFSDNTQAKLSFNPGLAVYIFPNVCTTVSFGLGGIRYTSVTQKDADGNKIGSRQASKMNFKLNIAEINIGVTVHLWDKKKK